jgi:hypothetical protein
MLLCALHADARLRGVRTIKLTCEEHRERALRLYQGFFEYRQDKCSKHHFVLDL